MLEVITIGFLFGASLGSFLNVCAYRIPRGVSVVSGRSFCPACLRVLSWYELIPILSFTLICRGRCTYCRAPIPIQDPLVEFLSGTWLLFVVLTVGLSGESILLTLFGLSLLLVALIDWQHYLIPNMVLLWSLCIGIAMKASMGLSALWPAVLALALSFLVAFLLLLSGRFMFGREVMGMGDVKLAAVIGFMLGFSGLLLSLWLGAVGGLGLAAVRKVFAGDRASKDERIPFGSFLALSSVALALLEAETQSFILLPELPWPSF
jgi:leader peptidase (prepilin peptidase) / N-methyltransferase